MSEKSIPVNKLLGDLGDVLAEQVAKQAEIQARRAAAQTLRQYLIESPLYQSITLEEGVHEDLVSQLRQEGGGYDCYCVACLRETPFQREHSVYRYQRDELRSFADAFLVTVMKCQRDKAHQQVFYSQIEDRKLRKIGQVPTFEDIAFGDVEKYRAVLGQKSFSELHRAGGLASFGVGIGAFVYLRRIFERMIAEHHERLAAAGKPVEGFEGLRVDEKIAALRDVLPPLLVTNRKAYGILSLGIHELDEDFCRAHFQVIRMAIVRMAEQDFERREAEKADAAMAIELDRIAAVARSNR